MPPPLRRLLRSAVYRVAVLDAEVVKQKPRVRVDESGTTNPEDR
jgi:hypothetical protein